MILFKKMQKQAKNTSKKPVFRAKSVHFWAKCTPCVHLVYTLTNCITQLYSNVYTVYTIFLSICIFHFPKKVFFQKSVNLYIVYTFCLNHHIYSLLKCTLSVHSGCTLCTHQMSKKPAKWR